MPGVAELADAPDLGLRNHRFQNVASRFKTKPLHDRKTADFGEILQFTNTEQKTYHSSANSSTRTDQSHARVHLTIDMRTMFVLPSNALHCGREADDERSRATRLHRWMKGVKKLAAPNMCSSRCCPSCDLTSYFRKINAEPRRMLFDQHACCRHFDAGFIALVTRQSARFGRLSGESFLR